MLTSHEWFSIFAAHRNHAGASKTKSNPETTTPDPWSHPRGSDLICLEQDLSSCICKVPVILTCGHGWDLCLWCWAWVLHPCLQPGKCHLEFPMEQLPSYISACCREEMIKHAMNRNRSWLWVCSLRLLALNFLLKKMISSHRKSSIPLPPLAFSYSGPVVLNPIEQY